MLYDLTADAYQVLNHAEQENRSRALARQRLPREALGGRQERHTNPIPGLVGWLRKLTKQEPRVTTEPAG
jgi:hypothetical protein